MAFEFKHRLIGPAEPLIRRFNVAANQDIKKGDLVTLNTSGLVTKAAAGQATILGVAQHDVKTGAAVAAGVDTVLVLIPKDSVFTVPYVGTTKTSLTDADISKTFDITTGPDGGHVMNLDDTAGGMCVVWDYNNAKKTADVVLTKQLF